VRPLQDRYDPPLSTAESQLEHPERLGHRDLTPLWPQVNTELTSVERYEQRAGACSLATPAEVLEIYACWRSSLRRQVRHRRLLPSTPTSALPCPPPPTPLDPLMRSAYTPPLASLAGLLVGLWLLLVLGGGFLVLAGHLLARLVRLWSVTPGVTRDNRGPPRTLIQQFTGRPGSSTDHRPVAYNDEAAGSSPATPTTGALTRPYMILAALSSSASHADARNIRAQRLTAHHSTACSRFGRE
jgi:hypothetical protein